MSIRILHFSTHDEACGIGKYQEMFLDALEDDNELQNDFFEVSPNRFKSLGPDAYGEIFDALKFKLKEYDILHIQHEFGFFPNGTFEEICRIAKELDKKLVVTVHTSIAAVPFPYPEFYGRSPRKLLGYARRWFIRSREHAAFLRNFGNALKSADRIIVHNFKARADLAKLGVSGEKFEKFSIPVPIVDRSVSSTSITRKLRRSSDDIIVASAGFINRYKGTSLAVEALAMLPERYKLAIIGGLHPTGAGSDYGQEFYDEVVNLIETKGLKDRVLFTGYIEDDTQLNALIRECDLCIYPYDRAQYSNSSSAALNNAFANHLPVVGFPTPPFKEINEGGCRYIELADGFTSQSLASSIMSTNLETAGKMSKEYADAYSYPVTAKKLEAIYSSLGPREKVKA